MDARPTSSAATQIGLTRQKLHLSRQPMLVLAIAGVGGIALDRVVSIQTEIWLAMIAAAMVALVATAIWNRFRTAAVLILFALTMSLYHHCQYNYFPESNLSRFVSEDWQPLFVEALVASPVQSRPDTLADQRSEAKIEARQSIFEIDVVAVRDGFDYRPSSGRSRLVVDGVVEGLLHGDRIRIACKGQCIGAASNPGEVDLQSIYRSRRQLVRLHADSPEQVRLLQRGTWSLARLTHWIGDRGHYAITSHLDQDSAALAEALVLGRREAVDRQLRDRLLETGTIHLLAVSGLHVGIVAVAVSWLAFVVGLPRTCALSCVVFVCLIYMLVTGARPPVIRAATLITLFLIGQMLGRRTDSMNTLATAAILLMLLDPLSISQVGTHLSFLAVATIVLSTPLPEPEPSVDPLEELLRSRWTKIVRRFKQIVSGIVQVVRMSFWIWCLGLPLVWYHFHIVSPVSIIANVILWIPLTVALISGLLTAVLEASGYRWGTGRDRCANGHCSRSLDRRIDGVHRWARISGCHRHRAGSCLRSMRALLALPF
ncbi:MAG: ComEC/Rec2 family competence protein [Pirellulaceae bacterium]